MYARNSKVNFVKTTWLQTVHKTVTSLEPVAKNKKFGQHDSLAYANQRGVHAEFDLYRTYALFYGKWV